MIRISKDRRAARARRESRVGAGEAFGGGTDGGSAGGFPSLGPPMPVTLGHMADVTQLLDAAAAGDRKAAADLLPLVYDELRQVAAAPMAGEAPQPSLDTSRP